jgi:hypothetical protein
MAITRVTQGEVRATRQVVQDERRKVVLDARVSSVFVRSVCVRSICVNSVCMCDVCVISIYVCHIFCV